MSTTKPPQKVLAVTAAADVATPLLDLSSRSLEFTYMHGLVPAAGPLAQPLTIRRVGIGKEWWSVHSACCTACTRAHWSLRLTARAHGVPPLLAGT